MRFGSERFEIELFKRVAERFGGVFEIRCARAGVAVRWANGASGNERIAAVRMEADPAKRGAKKAGTVGRDMQGVRAAEINGDGAWSIHNKFTGRGPDGGVNGAFLE